MGKISDIVFDMKKTGRIVRKSYYEDVEMFRYLHELSAIIDDQNLKRLKVWWERRFELSFSRYDVDDLSENKYTIYNNESFGYNILLITGDLNHFKKVDNIWIPDKFAPCYIELGEGYYYILAPMELLESMNETLNVKLSKPQKALSSFW